MFRMPLLLVAVGLQACAGIPVGGILHSNVSHPHAVSSNQVGPRVGEACARSILFLVAWGDSSTERARRNGGITEISLVDKKFKNFGPFYSQSCTIVRGR